MAEEARCGNVALSTVRNNARRGCGEFVHHPRTPRPVFEFSQATGNDHLGAVFAAIAQPAPRLRGLK
jgi:hypothetical protein